jgi:glycosyltransferase involved in cell wall biosynthesis
MRAERTAPQATDARVVWVTPHLEALPRSGGSLRTHRLLRALSAEYAVDLVVLSERPVDLSVLLAETGVQSVEVFAVPRGRLRTRGNQLIHLWPQYASRVWHPEARSLVEQSAQSTIVVLEHLSAWPYRPKGRPYLLNLQNVESEIVDSLPQPASAVRRLERAWERATLHRIERAATSDPLARTVVVSDRDAQLLGAQDIVPNGTDPAGEVDAWQPRQDLLFVASIDYPPNRLAIDWWTDVVWPRLPRHLPKLKVVGRGTERIEESDAVVGVGEVPSVAPFLSAASVVVIPLQHGGGTRLKLLEALAWKRPVVTTTKGAEGLGVRDGVEVLVADDGEAFARAVARVWEDRDLAAQLCENGSRFVTAFYWEVIGARFVDVVRSFTASTLDRR